MKWLTLRNFPTKNFRLCRRNSRRFALRAKLEYVIPRPHQLDSETSPQSQSVSGRGGLSLLIAANGHLVCHASRGRMRIDREMTQPRVFVSYLVHLAAIRRTGDRDRAGEDQRCQTQDGACHLQCVHHRLSPLSSRFITCNPERRDLRWALRQPSRKLCTSG